MNWSDNGDEMVKSAFINNAECFHFAKSAFDCFICLEVEMQNIK